MSVILADVLLQKETVDIGFGLRNRFGIFCCQALCQLHRDWDQLVFFHYTIE
jgi:hypothetical protein